jgi:hypothetical protein
MVVSPKNMKSIRAYGKLYQNQVAADSHLHPTAQPMDSDFAGWASNGGPAVLIPEKREGGVVVTVSVGHEMHSTYMYEVQ